MFIFILASILVVVAYIHYDCFYLLQWRVYVNVILFLLLIISLASLSDMELFYRVELRIHIMHYRCCENNIPMLAYDLILMGCFIFISW